MNSLTLSITYADDIFKTLSNGPYYSLNLVNFVSAADIYKLIKNNGIIIDYINIVSIPEGSFIEVLSDSYKCNNNLIIIDRVPIKDFIKDIPHIVLYFHPYLFSNFEQSEELLYSCYTINHEIIKYIIPSLQSADIYEKLININAKGYIYIPDQYKTQDMIISVVKKGIIISPKNDRITLDTFNKISNRLHYEYLYSALLNPENVLIDYNIEYYDLILSKFMEMCHIYKGNKDIIRSIFKYSNNKRILNKMINLYPYIIKQFDTLPKNSETHLLDLKPSLFKYFNVSDDIACKMLDKRFVNIWYIRKLNENIFNYFISKYSARRIKLLYYKIKYRLSDGKSLGYFDYKNFIELYDKYVNKIKVKKLCLNNVKVQTEDIILEYLDHGKNNAKYVKLYTKKIVDKINTL